MIKNQRQLKATKAQIASFRAALQEIDNQEHDGSANDRARHDAARRAMQSMLTTMERQSAEFEALTRGDASGIALNGLHDLPKALIQTRIVLGMSQKDLAQKIGVKAQQVQRWEHEDYERITFANLEAVSAALNISSKLELRRPVRQTKTGSSGPHFGELRCISLLHPIHSAWSRTTPTPFVHARGQLHGAANEGTGTGSVVVTESTQGVSVDIKGLGARLDGSYSKTAAKKPSVSVSDSRWTDFYKEQLRA